MSLTYDMLVFNMGLLDFIIKPLLDILGKKEKKITVIEEKEAKNSDLKEKEVHSIWDYLQFKDNTQAFHLISVVGFDTWVDMDEIRRRIKELFGVDYKNERSLYPYLKTLTDTNLLETNDIGGKRKWRKKQLFIAITKKKAEIKERNNDEKEEIAAISN